MAAIITGRKLFNINKNMESGDGIYYSQIYAKSRFSPDLPIVPVNYDPNAKQIELLKQALTDKEEKLQELKQMLNKPSDNNRISPVFHDIVTNSAYDSRQCVEIYKSHFKDLEHQIIDKQRKRVDEIIEKQKELKERLQYMHILRDIEYKERQQRLEKADEYRKHLNIQQNFDSYIHEEPKKSRSVTPRNNSNIIYSMSSPGSNITLPGKIPKIYKEQIFPHTKNQNRVTVELSSLPAFQQPKYTKNNPKYVPSFPVIGTKPNNIISRPEFKQDIEKFCNAN